MAKKIADKEQTAPKPDRAETLAKSKGTPLLTREESDTLQSIMAKLGYKSESAMCKEPDGTPFAEVVRNKFFQFVARA